MPERTSLKIYGYGQAEVYFVADLGVGIESGH
jgi:hypothetical protein